VRRDGGLFEQKAGSSLRSEWKERKAKAEANGLAVLFD
jgi:hypothetical protein